MFAQPWVPTLPADSTSYKPNVNYSGYTSNSSLFKLPSTFSAVFHTHSCEKG